MELRPLVVPQLVVQVHSTEEAEMYAALNAARQPQSATRTEARAETDRPDYPAVTEVMLLEALSPPCAACPAIWNGGAFAACCAAPALARRSRRRLRT